MLDNHYKEVRVSTITLLPGVDRHGAGFRVRLSFHGETVTETGIETAEAANATALRWRELRKAGLRPDQAADDLTLGERAEAFLTRKRKAVSRKTKRPLRPGGIAWWERVTKPWREGPLAKVPLSLLNPNRVADVIEDRENEHPKSARDELQALKAIIREAGRRGASYDPALLALEGPAPSVRQRQALDVEQLELLAASAMPYAQDLILFLGTTGMRIGEAFAAEPGHYDRKAGSLYVPDNKEGEPKWVELTREEGDLLRRRILARPHGSRTIFTTRTGLTWEGRYTKFWRDVWAKATAKAAEAWRERKGLPDGAPTPYDDLKPHDLRATAATLMRDAGFSREDAAARLGHHDAGQLLGRIYDQGDKRARTRRAIDRLAPEGLRAGRAGRPATIPGAPDATLAEG